MADLARIIREAQQSIVGKPTLDVLEMMHTAMCELEQKVTALEQATLARAGNPGCQHCDDAYAEAFTDVLSALIVMGTAATEATLARGIAWAYVERRPAVPFTTPN